MKKQIFLLVFGSCIGIGVFLYSVFAWYSTVLVASQRPIQETVGENTVLPSFSLKDQFGQMLMIGFEGTQVTPEIVSLFSDIRPGGVLLLSRNIESKEQVTNLIADLQEISIRITGLPLFVAVDQEGGVVARVPWAESTAAPDLKDVNEVFLIGEQRARDLQEVGVNMNLGPVLDSSGQEDFLFNRTFQKDSATALELASALIAGQRKESVIAVPKHFPGYDGVSFNPENGILPTAVDFPSASLFQAVLQSSQSPFVMLSHVIYEAVDADNPLPLSQIGMELVRKELGEQVLFMSDDLASKSLMAHYSLRDIGKNALNSGVNILLIGGYPNTAVVKDFYGAMQDVLVQSKTALRGANAYEILSGIIAGDGKLQEHIKASADKIIKVKRKMLSWKTSELQ